jgi:RNA polymerase sigma-70 factor (family 1)
MKLFNDGDAKAFEKVFTEYYPSMVYYAKSFLREKDAARDIAQDALTKLWENRCDMKNPENIKAFLYVTTRNACLNYLRHEKVVQNTMNKLPGYFETTTAGIEDISLLKTEVVSVEVLQLITEVLAKMPEKYRHIITLLYFENKSLQEVSSLLKLPYQTVSTHKIRALKLLKLLCGNHKSSDGV